MAQEGARRGERIPVGRGPKHPLLTVREMMDRVVDTFLEPLTKVGPSEWRTESFRPSVDVVEEETQIRVEVEMPGVNPADVEVSVGENSVTVRGEKKLEAREEDRGYHRAERPFGSFRRTIPLPVEVDPENAIASFKDGVLRITFPKTERKEKKVPIKIE